MFRSTMLEWIVTILAFVVSAAVLFVIGYSERGSVGAISFCVAAAAYAIVVRYEKKNGTMR